MGRSVSFSFKFLLTSLAVVPLLAATGFGIVLTAEAVGNYNRLKAAASLQRVSEASGALLTALPGESAAPPAQWPEVRKTVDARYQAVVDAYKIALDHGVNDRIFASLKQDLDGRFAKMAEFRQLMDSGKADPMTPLRYLQPLAAMALEMSGRSAALVSDADISGAIKGLYALMQVNDGYLIMSRTGQSYAKNGRLSPEEYPMAAMGYNQIRIYMKTMREFASPAILEKYDAFWTAPEAAQVQKLIDDMAAGKTYTPGPNDLARWEKVTTDRRANVAELVKQAAQDLANLTNQKLNDAQSSLTLLCITLGAIVLLTIGFSLYVLRMLSTAIRTIAQRMETLAHGEKNSTIPYLDRSDEIGDIARSVDVFRLAAIRNDELEAQAERNRQRSEEERRTLQQQAEAEAEARLGEATAALAAGLKQLASGDMTCELRESLAPQFEELRHDFNRSVEQLRNALIMVGSAASAVNNGSGEISSASSDLAKRTEGQAASLEQTAAALEEVTTNVQATSKRASEARDLVREAQQRAGNSSRVVTDAVSAMEKIEQASRQINQIIGVIDEIAFQTNLLALNAGVEAARAGDAGKGFAVVAQEVRELAQRSANAAKEIKQLIGNSETAVAEGVKLVHETGGGLGEIARVVEAINVHMEAIATAAREQSLGLGEVNTAVNHMDQATQKNAAMVEEMSAASAGLADEAAKLSELLSSFKTADQGFSAQCGGMRRYA